MGMSVCLPSECKCLWKPKQGIISSRERITESGEQPCRCWELNQGPMEEQLLSHLPTQVETTKIFLSTQ